MLNYTLRSFIFDLLVIILPSVLLYRYTAAKDTFYKDKCLGVKITFFIIVIYIQVALHIKRTYVFTEGETKFDRLIETTTGYL